MRLDRPQFELRRVQADGTYGPPKIVPVTELPLDTRTGRRGFFGVGMTATAVLLASGCQAPATGPPPTATPMPWTLTAVARPSDRVQAYRRRVAALAFSPDGQFLASAGTQDQGSDVKLWRVADGSFNLTARDFATALSFSPDGQLLAVANGDLVRFLRASDGALVRTLDGSERREGVGMRRPMAFSRDGSIFAAATGENSVQLWRVADASRLQTLPGAAGWGVISVESSADGKMVGVAANTSAFWRVEDGRPISLPTRHEPWLGVAFSSDGQAAITVSATIVSRYQIDTLGRLTSEERFQLPRFVDPPESVNVRRVIFSSDLEVAAVELSKTPRSAEIPIDRATEKVRLWRVRDPTIAYEVEGGAGTFSADGRQFASTIAGEIIIWDLFPPTFQSFLFDPQANANAALIYHAQHPASGQTITYTVSCGSAIPAGATCVCNCVPGTYRVAPSPVPDRVVVPSGTSPGGGGQICTCVPVWIRR